MIVVGRGNNFGWSLLVMRFLRSLLSRLHWLAFGKPNDFKKNEQVRAVMRGNGDSCRIPRAIDHYAYFPTETERADYRAFVIARGYGIDHEDRDDDRKYPCGIIFIKVQVPDDIDDETMLLEVTAMQMKGGYDGWVTDVVRQA